MTFTYDANNKMISIGDKVIVRDEKEHEQKKVIAIEQTTLVLEDKLGKPQVIEAHACIKI